MARIGSRALKKIASKVRSGTSKNKGIGGALAAAGKGISGSKKAPTSRRNRVKSSRGPTATTVGGKKSGKLGTGLIKTQVEPPKKTTKKTPAKRRRGRASLIASVAKRARAATPAAKRSAASKSRAAQNKQQGAAKSASRGNVKARKAAGSQLKRSRKR